MVTGIYEGINRINCIIKFRKIEIVVHLTVFNDFID